MYKRNRFLYMLLLIIVIALGLASRKFSAILPDVLDTYLGDTLWALMIFLGFSFIFRQMKLQFIAALSLLFCYLIEISQLYHAPWIDNIRQTLLGGLILGYGFLWSDLLAYLIGVTLGIVIDLLLIPLTKDYSC